MHWDHPAGHLKWFAQTLEEITNSFEYTTKEMTCRIGIKQWIVSRITVAVESFRINWVGYDGVC